MECVATFRCPPRDGCATRNGGQMVDNCVKARSTVHETQSTRVPTDGKFWSSKVTNSEKTAQSARLVIHFGELYTVGDGVIMCKFTG
jgi:hypothetical protein